MIRNILVAFFVTMTGCNVQVMGDARDDCTRVETAIRSYANRCGLSFSGELPDCSEVWAGDVNAEGCESALADMSCERGSMPNECSMDLVAP